MGLRVVIPVAGVGTRLRPYTYSVPKALVPVAGMPMLGHILDELKAYPVDEVTLVIGYHGRKVREYVSSHFDFKFRFVEQQEMLGLGHAIWVTSPGYKDQDGPLLIILGDTIFEADFGKILNSGENWIGVAEVEDPRRFGVVALEGDRIKAMVEKPDVPPTNLAIVGIYYFNDSRALYQALDDNVKNNVRTRGEIQLTDAMSLMLERGVVMKPFAIEGWFDCGKPETLIETNRELLDRYQRAGKLPKVEFPGCVINQPVAIERGAVIENSVVGPHVSLGEDAVIRNSVVSDSVIGGCTEVADCVLRGSIIADNARIQGRANKLNVGDTSFIELG